MDQDDFNEIPFVTIKHRNKPLVANIKDLLDVPSVIGDRVERKTTESVRNLGSRNTKENISSNFRPEGSG
jgi:hypothetical protein